MKIRGTWQDALRRKDEQLEERKYYDLMNISTIIMICICFTMLY